MFDLRMGYGRVWDGEGNMASACDSLLVCVYIRGIPIRRRDSGTACFCPNLSAVNASGILQMLYKAFPDFRLTPRYSEPTRPSITPTPSSRISPLHSLTAHKHRIHIHHIHEISPSILYTDPRSRISAYFSPHTCISLYLRLVLPLSTLLLRHLVTASISSRYAG